MLAVGLDCYRSNDSSIATVAKSFEYIDDQTHEVINFFGPQVGKRERKRRMIKENGRLRERRSILHQYHLLPQHQKVQFWLQTEQPSE